MLVVLLATATVSFVLIELPPGDYLTSYIMQLRESGADVSKAEIAALEKQYGLNLPLYRRYLKWLGDMLRGDFGRSFEWNRPVGELLVERLPLTIIISSFSMVFIYGVGVPIGMYSALHQYSVRDYVFTFLGVIGLATPNFLLALILMFGFYSWFGWSPGGLFSLEYEVAAWSIAKFLDMLKHLPVPVIVIGTAGTAGVIRIMRGVLLDELRKQYVITARAKGVVERKLLFKYPVRVSINPIVSTIGWVLPAVVSGSTITAIVLSLPTTGALLFGALMSQDSYLAGSAVLFLSVLTVLGTFISDILLSALDPRIRMSRQNA
jgi:peptide/nickel transport system permease protein